MAQGRHTKLAYQAGCNNWKDEERGNIRNSMVGIHFTQIEIKVTRKKFM